MRVSLLAFATGSPPPMRGKEKHLFSALLDRGITPAYAGKSTGYVNHYPKSEDHPRLCGEKRNRFPSGFRCRGSPPPMRGKAQKSQAGRMADGITPAYAGKRSSPPSSVSPSKDHPRLCGEKCSPHNPPLLRRGSPPPMRGKVLCMLTSKTKAGITPAYAGKRGLDYKQSA